MLSDNEKLWVKYGLSLCMQEIHDKIEPIRNNANHLKELSTYKKQLQYLDLLIRKFD